MSSVPKSLRNMRIISIPLARPKLNIHGTTDPKRVLTYYKFQMSSPPPPSEVTVMEEMRTKSRWLPEEGIVKFLQTKAAATWAGFGKAEEGSWKVRLCFLL